MTNQQFEQARIMLQQIEHIDKLLDMLGGIDDYKCDPPIRSSSWHLTKSTGSKPDMELNEGEVVTIIKTLLAERRMLEYEFGAL